MLLTKTQCGKTVCGLSGLTDHNRQCMRIQNWITITEFRCKLYTHRNPCHILDHILRCHTYMIGGSAGNDINLGNIPDFFLCKSNLCKIDPVIPQDRIQSVLDCLRLLMDLFHHEMLKTGLLCCLCVPVDYLQFFLDLFTVQIIECNLALMHTGHLHIPYIINISCIFQDCRNI